ncbi:MAG: DUF1499 domain-containing protein [Pseudolabrys sp.]
MATIRNRGWRYGPGGSACSRWRVAALSVIIVRSGLLEIVPALATFGAALAFAGLAILLAFASFIGIWRHGLKGLGNAILGIFLGLLLLGYPAYLGYRASKLPAVTDVTTDMANPPRFDTLARLRPRGRTDYLGGVVAERQRAAYPDIAPLQLSVPPKAAYDMAMALITKRKWRIVDSRPPSPGRRDAVIEAVAQTLIMGFRDDVVVRVSPLGPGARVDVRSASRYGFHDFGANASRVGHCSRISTMPRGNAPEPHAAEPRRRHRRRRSRRKKRGNGRLLRLLLCAPAAKRDPERYLRHNPGTGDHDGCRQSRALAQARKRGAYRADSHLGKAVKSGCRSDDQPVDADRFGQRRGRRSADADRVDEHRAERENDGEMSRQDSRQQHERGDHADGVGADQQRFDRHDTEQTACQHAADPDAQKEDREIRADPPRRACAVHARR